MILFPHDFVKYSSILEMNIKSRLRNGIMTLIMFMFYFGQNQRASCHISSTHISLLAAV